MELGIEYQRFMERQPWRLRSEGFMSCASRQYELGEYDVEIDLYYVGDGTDNIYKMNAFIIKKPYKYENLLLRQVGIMPTVGDLEAFKKMVREITNEYFSKEASCR